MHAAHGRPPGEIHRDLRGLGKLCDLAGLMLQRRQTALLARRYLLLLLLLLGDDEVELWRDVHLGRTMDGAVSRASSGRVEDMERRVNSVPSRAMTPCDRATKDVEDRETWPPCAGWTDADVGDDGVCVFDELAGSCVMRDRLAGCVRKKLWRMESVLASRAGRPEVEAYSERKGRWAPMSLLDSPCT
ncbi:hypothetical protein P43SY_010230 [Pythium insidiosum]|uniref:Uncharacterized protein n=1 Tax=Pythium insidiosum TaxID=114742 RepID=A0AAD5Q4G6_PYTIN|nr:hypothetical protein P43SY_010230 [Pythium insidiosum]